MNSFDFLRAIPWMFRFRFAKKREIMAEKIVTKEKEHL
jgi:hypothetical protein